MPVRHLRRLIGSWGRTAFGRLLVHATLALLMSSSSAHAQVRWRSAPALEREQNRAAPIAIEAQLDQLAGAGGAEQARASRHVLLRFDGSLSVAEKAELEASGIVLGAYVGDHAYFVQLQLGRFDARRATRLGRIESAHEIQRVWKLHPDLAAGIIHPWTVLDEGMASGKADEMGPPFKMPPDQSVAVIVLFHNDVTLEPEALRLVRSHGGRQLSTIEALNGMVISLPRSRIGLLADEDGVQYLEPPLPVFSGNNQQSRSTHRVDDVHASPFNLSGAGVDVLVYDTGKVYEHQDFSGRLTIGSPDFSSISNHSTHVAGTVAGNGDLSGGLHTGMAPGADIISFSFETGGPLEPGFLYTDPGDIENDYSIALTLHGADVANNSIGSNVASNGLPCDWEGDYGVTAALIDSIVGGSLGVPLSIVWAAGNERGSGRCGTSFRTIAPPAGAKNHIAIGAINSVTESLAFFSSMGPTDDGRLKPEVVASGCQTQDDLGVTSVAATPLSGLDYTTLCGTSMAAPAVTGIIALLLEDFAAQYPLTPPPLPATIKALVVQTAKDLGAPGPEYSTGYGSVQADRAVEALRSGFFTEGQVSQSGREVTVARVEASDGPLKVTLAWDDAPGTPNVVPSLINDLDLVVTSPSGQRFYPWTLSGVADPAAPAIRTSANRVDNLEQVLVDSPELGSWLIEIVGHDVPVGPQTFGLFASALIGACTDLGVLGLDAASYSCQSSIVITAVDCGPNVDPGVLDTLDVLVTSTSDPTGAIVQLTEITSDSGAFVGSVTLGTTDGVLVVEGDVITARYLDQDDGSGLPAEVSAQANTDCTLPVISDVAFPVVSGLRAVVTFSTSEPTSAEVRLGISCDALDQQLTRFVRLTGHTFEILGLTPDTTYFLEIRAIDEAGNEQVDDLLGQCHSFRTIDLPEISTEFFESLDFDLSFTTLEFTPIPGPDRYRVCAVPISELPTDPLQGSPLALGDDLPLTDPLELVDSKQIVIFEQVFDSFFPNPNGNITFTRGDIDWTPSFDDHFETLRISALFIDVSPNQGGIVSWQQLDNRVVISFVGVPQFKLNDSNTFQFEMYFDGRIRLSYLEIGARNAMVGLSGSGGVPTEFLENDLSSQVVCSPVPPWSVDTLDVTPLATAIDLDLGVMDDGLPGPMIVTIVELPQGGVLIDPSAAGFIQSVPHDLPPGVSAVRYVPLGSFRGIDTLRFLADDGGIMPSGGTSPEAMASVRVGDMTTIFRLVGGGIHPSFVQDFLWFYGTTLGQGGVFEEGGQGFTDPTSGLTGGFVLGYNTFGNYLPDTLQTLYATAGPFDCSQSRFTQLEYQRWLGVESSFFDHASVEVSTNAGLTWFVIWQNPARSLPAGAWEKVSHDLSFLLDGRPDVRVRFGMGPTDSAINYCGWSLDDVRLRGLVPLAECPGDTNFDRVVNFDDVTSVLRNWNLVGATQTQGDGNADGIADFDDIQSVLANWGAICPTP